MATNAIKRFFGELRRRSVFKVGVAYLVAAWLFIEVVSTLLPTFEAPTWALQALTVIAIAGFPVVLILSWAFDWTPEGIVRDEAVDRTGRHRVSSADSGHVARLAVLPLDAMSSSDEDNYLADGLTEDLITLLSRTPGLFVIARNSSYVYKGKVISIRQVAEELGVRYVVEGSCRRFKDSVRVNVQLIDGESEEHVWAERFDFSLDSLFSTQEDICRKISMQLSVPLISAESERAARLPAEDIDAWLLTQRAILTYYFAGPGKQTATESLALLLDALEREPDYPYALAFHAHMCTTTVALGFSDDLERDTKLAFQQIEKARHLAPADPMVLWCYGVVHGFLGDLQTAISALEQAVEKNPNDAHALADLGGFLARTGRFAEGREILRRVFELSPNEPRSYIWHFYMGSNYFVDDGEAALEQFEKSISIYSNYVPAWIGRIAILAIMGRMDEAAAAAAKFKTVYPDPSMDRITHLIRMGPMQDPALQEKLLGLLAQAGLGD